MAKMNIDVESGGHVWLLFLITQRISSGTGKQSCETSIPDYSKDSLQGQESSHVRHLFLVTQITEK